MGRKLILMLLFITCSLHAMAQTDYYYDSYYGTKIPLILNENKVLVSVPIDCNLVMERIRANVQPIMTTETIGFFYIYITRTDLEKLTSLDTWEEDSKSVIITPCYYRDYDMEETYREVFLTPFLQVTLKKEEDIDLLTSYAEEYKLKIDGSNPYYPLVYSLHVTLESEKNALGCANEMHESGFFESSQPDFAIPVSGAYEPSDPKEDDPMESSNNIAQEYYPEGTKWTEIRLDTLKYDSWYSKVDDEWVPNFETIEYYVKGEYTTKYGEKYKCIYTNGPEWTDSLTFGIQEGELIQYNEDDDVIVTVFAPDDYGSYSPLGWAETYQFDWGIGKGISFENLFMSTTTYAVKYQYYYGIIDEIKEGYFGGSQPLKYVDLDGKAPEYDKYGIDTKGGRIIQGIGITEWNDGECLFGPPDPYNALDEEYPVRHYRSMLVHFERNGEVLYDVWPEKVIPNGIKSISKVKPPVATTLYDLNGRRVQGTPQKGVYIQNGKVVVIK